MQQIERLMWKKAHGHLQRVGRWLGEVCRNEDMTVRCARAVSDYEDRHGHSSEQSLDSAAEDHRPAGEQSFTCNASHDEVDALGYGHTFDDIGRLSLLDQYCRLLEGVAELGLQSFTNATLCDLNSIRWRPPRGRDVPVIRQVRFIEFLESMQHRQMRLTIGRNRDCATQ